VQSKLVPSRGGVFEISVDGKTIFSKRALDRFPEEGEIVELIRAE
jgi:selenoprotein W-related protein